MLKGSSFFNVPNAFSLLRICLIPVILYFMAVGGNKIVLLLLVAAAIATDFLDGYSARKLGQITNAGKILDPIADKVAVAVIIVGLIFLKDFPLWAAAVIISRDIVILSADIYIIKRMTYIPVSNSIGKITVNVFACLILTYIFDITFLQMPFLFISMIFLALSSIGYGWEMFAALRKIKMNK